MWSIILPIFAIIVSGWILRHFKCVSDELAQQLMHFVRRIAMPLLVANAFAMTSWGDIWNWEYIGAFGIPVFGMFIIVMYFLSVVKKQNRAHAAARSHFMCVGSDVNIFGLAFLYGIFGRKMMVSGALTYLMIFAVFSIAIGLMEMKRSTTDEGVRTALRTFFFNTLVIGAIVGMLYSLTGWSIPLGVTKYLVMFEYAMVATALFATGILIDFTSFQKTISKHWFAYFWKFVVMPFIVFWVMYTYGIDPMWAVVGIYVAAFPCPFQALDLTIKYVKDKQLSDCLIDFVETSIPISIILLFFWSMVIYAYYPSVF